MGTPADSSPDDPARAGEETEAVIRLERSLLDPHVRRSPEAVRALLHPDFSEFGASGRIWDANSVAASLAAEPGAETLTATDFSGHQLAPGVLLLTFRTERAGVSCLRSSLWLRPGGRWLLRFHQATVLPPAAPTT